ACGVDAKWEGLKSTRYPVKGGEGALAIANEANQTPRRIEIGARDLARGVDAHAFWTDAGRTRWVEAGEGAPAIAHEAVINRHKDGVKTGDLARGVDACWLGAGRTRYVTRYVKAGDGAPAIANEATQTPVVRQ